MDASAALFLFLSAVVISVFAFLSIATWSSIPARERWHRDRMMLLKSIAEHQSENATRVLDMLKEEARRKEEKELAEKRQGVTLTGAFMVPIGIVLYFAVGYLALIPVCIGVVLIGYGLVLSSQARKQQGSNVNLH